MLQTTDSIKKYFINEFNKKYNISLQQTENISLLNDFFTLTQKRETLMNQIPGLLMNLLNLSDVNFYDKLFSLEDLQNELHEIKENLNKNIKFKLDQDIENISIAFNKGDYKETLLCINKSFINLIRGIEKFWDDLEENPSLNIFSIKNGLILLSTYVMMNYGPIIQTLNLIVKFICKEDDLYNEATIFSNLLTLQQNISAKDPFLAATINSYQTIANIIPDPITSILNLKLNPEKTKDFFNYTSKNSKVALDFLKNLDINQKNFENTSNYPDYLKNILRLTPEPNIIEKKIKDINSSNDSSLKKVINIYEAIFKSFSNLPNNENITMSENIKFKEAIGKYLDKLKSDFTQQILNPLKIDKELEKILISDKATEIKFNSLIKSTNLIATK